MIFAWDEEILRFITTLQLGFSVSRAVGTTSTPTSRRAHTSFHWGSHLVAHTE